MLFEQFLVLLKKINRIIKLTDDRKDFSKRIKNTAAYKLKFKRKQEDNF